MTAQPISREAARELAERAGLIVLDPDNVADVESAVWNYCSHQGDVVEDENSSGCAQCDQIIRHLLTVLQVRPSEPLTCQNCDSPNAVTITVCRGCAFLIKGES